jgi:hypothetical protein
MHGQRLKASHRRERGVTIVMTAIGLVALISMLALAIDVVNLYVSAGEAQKAADAAALAGAKGFVSSGFTSGQLGPPALLPPKRSFVVEARVCRIFRRRLLQVRILLEPPLRR